MLRSSYEYTAYFCEENIWHLGKSLVQEGYRVNEMFVLMFSNENRQVVLYQQSAAPPQMPIIWDYHVVLLHEEKDAPVIFDFDSRLSFPCPFSAYIHQTFHSVEDYPSCHHFLIRKIPLSAFHRSFESNRSHMYGKDGSPICPFPTAPPIRHDPNAEGIDLWEYLDMTQNFSDGSRVYPSAVFLDVGVKNRK